MKKKVEREERLHRQRHSVVGVWLTSVEDVHTRFKKLDSASAIELENLCLGDLC